MKKFFIILSVLLLLGMVSGCQKEELEDMITEIEQKREIYTKG